MSRIKNRLNTINISDDAESIFAMVNLRQNSTGLPMVIWVSERGHTQHGPRIKVSKTYTHKADIKDSVSVSVSISDNPEIMAGSGLSQKDFELVKNYIINKNALLDYGYGRIDMVEFVNSLVKIAVE